ncbi:PQQ-binding-like beta-propeller repeat protein [Natronosalvus halobius]|uniref:outer membrane protein assembly factor BamB family protein n=1 Tax=Natronosalvus halobius TaxID=2953746 RepID=UPI00209D545D|nr:PQQ-binding-like beta-propeller repeat protein [Natronosalvus halobius]USZ72267.1 PQQ-like beta-propeller repeat protein [Natronosalvus halobius]
MGGATVIPPVSAQNGELFRETIDDGGATASVSESGSIIAFGVYPGTARAYIATDSNDYEAVEFVLPGDSSGFPVSHVAVTEETNTIVAAAMDVDVFGGGNLDDAGGLIGTPSTEAEWAYEQPGLWDIGVSGDLTTVAAVSNPMDVAPHVGVVQEGELAWEQPLEDAAGWAVDVSDDGQYIAVACVHIDDGLERSGQPNVRLYGADGDLLWRHETAEDVLDIAINEDEGIVVAGTDDWSTLAFDLDGELRWQRDESPTMTVLSGDGTTIVAESPVTALDSSDGSVLWESEMGNANVVADPMTVSADGTRVAVSTLDFELFVLENGEPIWEGENEAGPYYSAISADGSTLAAMEVDNDAKNAALVGYPLGT